jgi:hypothetical protein
MGKKFGNAIRKSISAMEVQVEGRESAVRFSVRFRRSAATVLGLALCLSLTACSRGSEKEVSEGNSIGKCVDVKLKSHNSRDYRGLASHEAEYQVSYNSVECSYTENNSKYYYSILFNRGSLIVNIYSKFELDDFIENCSPERNSNRLDYDFRYHVDQSNDQCIKKYPTINKLVNARDASKDLWVSNKRESDFVRSLPTTSAVRTVFFSAKMDKITGKNKIINCFSYGEAISPEKNDPFEDSAVIDCLMEIF